MKNVHIVTDSTCHIPAALCQELEIHVVQLPYVWDNITYFDDEISPRDRRRDRSRQSSSRWGVMAARC